MELRKNPIFFTGIQPYNKCVSNCLLIKSGMYATLLYISFRSFFFNYSPFSMSINLLFNCVSRKEPSNNPDVWLVLPMIYSVNLLKITLLSLTCITLLRKLGHISSPRWMAAQDVWQRMLQIRNFYFSNSEILWGLVTIIFNYQVVCGTKTPWMLTLTIFHRPITSTNKPSEP